MYHKSVLLNECINNLNLKEDSVIVDCTLGYAGHSSEILKRIKSNGHLYGFDQDAVAIETARARLSKISPQFTLIHTNFRNMKQELKLKLKDMLEDEVDEKYYLSEKMIDYITATNEKWTGNNSGAIVNRIAACTINTAPTQRRRDASNYVAECLPENTDLQKLRGGATNDKRK